MTAAIREAIRGQALTMGFDAVGFAEAQLAAEARAGLAEYIDRGYHGDMGWLAPTAPPRGGPPGVLGLAARRPPGVVARRTHGRCARSQLRRRRRSPCRDFRSRARRDLGLCPRPGLPRHSQEAAQGPGALDRGTLAGRIEGVRRYRAGHGKTAGATGRDRLAG